MAKATAHVGALGGATPPCAGVAFVTFNDANDAVRLLLLTPTRTRTVTLA